MRYRREGTVVQIESQCPYQRLKNLELGKQHVCNLTKNLCMHWVSVQWKWHITVWDTAVILQSGRFSTVLADPMLFSDLKAWIER